MDNTSANRNNGIASLATEDRPREKMVRLGAEALTNAELLAILVGTGTAEESVIELMQHILRDCDNNISLLGKRTVDELCSYRGIGVARAVSILAAFELGKRRSMVEDNRTHIESSRDIYALMKPRMQDLTVEECWVILMNQSAKVIAVENVSRGGITGTMVDVRMVLRTALLKQATTIALCHNHPSGNTRPSRDDDNLTKRLFEAGKIMQIRLVDHVIVTETGYYSYADEDRMGF
jgi:DNA repair protein RadC